MSKIQFTNNAESTLDGAILPGATSFSVPSGEGALFPTLTGAQICYVRLGTDISNEIVEVTARSGDTFTCEATSAGWGSGTDVLLVVSKEVLDALAQADGGGQVLQDHELRDYAETATSPSQSGGTLTLDLENGNVFDVTLVGDVTTCTISNPPASGLAGSLTLILRQDGTGGHDFSFPSGTLCPGGTAPTLSTGAGEVDVLILFTVDGGTSWFVMLSGAAFASPA